MDAMNMQTSIRNTAFSAIQPVMEIRVIQATLMVVINTVAMDSIASIVVLQVLGLPAILVIRISATKDN